MNLKDLYLDPKFPAAFAGKKLFSEVVRKRDRNIKVADVDKELRKIDAYTLHKPTKREPVYRRIYSRGIGHILQLDLVDMTKFANVNDGHTFLITIIDVFSKKAWAYPLKSKTAVAITKVMKPFFERNKCKLVEFDQGGEFVNNLFKKLLKKHKIKYFHVYSDRKAAIVERFNRTLKTRMYKSFTARGGHRWIDILQDLIDGYNSSKHRSIGGFAPNQVKKSNEKMIRRLLYPPIKKEKRSRLPAFKVGDNVRIAMKKETFQKGYEQTHSYEVFTVRKILHTYPVTYRIQDYKKEEVDGSFYKGEIQLVDKSDGIWPINKILGTVKRRGVRCYRVNFLGYPESLTQLIPQHELFDV
jgi:transposase InsO family protein